MKRVFLLLFILIAFINCPKKGTDYDKTFQMKLLYDLSTKTQADPVSACVTSNRSAQTCISTASDVTPGTITETTLTLTLSKNQYNTYQNYCTNVIVPALGPSFNDSVKECLLNCQNSYWQIRIRDSICKDTTSSMISAMSQYTTSCTKNCLSNTNNPP